MRVSMSQRLRNDTKGLYGFDAVIQRVPPDAWDAASPSPATPPPTRGFWR